MHVKGEDKKGDKKKEIAKKRKKNECRNILLKYLSFFFKQLIETLVCNYKIDVF